MTDARSRRGDEAEVLGQPRTIIRLLTSAATIFKQALARIHPTVPPWMPLLMLVVLLNRPAIAQETTFAIKVLPSEAKQMKDPDTGVSLLFLTTNPANDQNLYYEQRSWLADSSVILFNSSRTNGGLMGYVTKTGELLRLSPPEGAYGGPTGANLKNSFYAIRGNKVVEVFLDIEYGPAGVSKAAARERVIASLSEEFMPPNTALSENSDGTLLALGVGGRGAGNAGKDASCHCYQRQHGRNKGGASHPRKRF